VSQRYLLDTNVISETRKLRADERVLSFIRESAPGALYLSVLCLGELRKGVAIKRKTDAKLAATLTAWVDGLEQNFSGRILPVDIAVATVWGEWSAVRSRPVVDTFLAATASVHNLVLVTRNETDVAGLPIRVVNPWKA
jgi:predicted nucleic acid-binding protein